MEMLMDAADWIATYAAVVATGALFLEVRRWVESGPNLAISVSANMQVFSNGEIEEKDLTIVTAVNIGDQPITLVALGLHEFESNWHALFRKSKANYIIPYPQFSGSQVNLPAILTPGQQWKGFIRRRDDKIKNMQDGNHWVAVHVASRDRAFIKAIPMKRAPEKNETQI